MIAFWAAPTMTQGHLLFSAVVTVYVLIALQLEERDLLAYHGETYSAYQRQVPMLIPVRAAWYASADAAARDDEPNEIRIKGDDHAGK